MSNKCSNSLQTWTITQWVVMIAQYITFTMTTCVVMIAVKWLIPKCSFINLGEKLFFFQNFAMSLLPSRLPKVKDL